MSFKFSDIWFCGLDEAFGVVGGRFLIFSILSIVHLLSNVLLESLYAMRSYEN